MRLKDFRGLRRWQPLLTSEATPKEELPKQNKAKIKLKPMSPGRREACSRCIKAIFHIIRDRRSSKPAM